MSKRFVSIVCIILVAVMLLSLVFTGIGSLTAHAVTQSEIDALEEQRDAIRAQQANVQNQLRSLESDRDTVMDRKAKLDEQSELNRQDIELINAQISLYDDMIAEKDKELQAALGVEKAQYDRYCERLRAMEENGNWSYLSFVFRATSFADLLSRLDDVMDIVTRDQDLEAEYAEAREDVADVMADYESIKSQQQLKKTELESREARLAEDIDAAGRLISDLQEDIDAYTALYDQAEADKQAISKKIEEKTAELKKQQEEEAERARQAAAAAAAAAAAQAQAQAQARAAAAAAAAAAAQQAQQSSASTSTSTNTYSNYTTTSDTSTATSSITSTQVDYSSTASTSSTGYYAWPSYTTYITSSFGYRVHPIFQTTKYHSGVDIGASYGTAVTAAAAGTVTIAESSSGYGNYVTIYHDNGSTTLYAHMSSIAVSAGDYVSQGQTIGYVGSTGYATGPHLHFEVRVNGACVDPMQYF